jgi:signal transduction histidine kinase
MEAVAFVSRDIHEPKLAHVRLEILSRLSAMVGSVDYEHVADALASIPIPDLADWCAVNLVEDRRIVRTCVTQCDASKAALREAVMRAAPEWSKNPLWTEMRVTSGFQLLGEVGDGLLRKITYNEEQYRFMKQMGVRSLLVQPVVSHGQVVAIFTLMYTTESGRRYGREDPALTAELALHAAHIVENARLLRDLRTSEARFRISIAGAKTAVFEQDTSLRYRWYYYRPVAPLDLLGRSDEESFQADEAAPLAAIKRRVLESGESASEELPLTLHGERRIYRTTIEPMRDQAEKTVGIIGSATDITDEKAIQQQLREAVAFRDRMMGVLGHDLRNPLNAVRMATAALLRLDLTDKATALGKVQIIQRATDRMTEMIETLLDLTRVRALGCLPVSRTPANLGALAREVIDEAVAANPDRAIHLQTHGPLEGWWDPGRVKEAISNLLSNALLHGDARGPVHVYAEGSGETVVLKVHNDGPPIPSELRPALFDAFSRGDKSPHGLGLGLFIVKQIALAHDGAVDVESSAQTGTTFTLVLPRGTRSG